MVGGIYLVRDFAQREIRHKVLYAMCIGALLSYIFASKEIALASIAGFIVGESIDWLIFTFTKKPLSDRLILSALASAPVDTLVFMVVAGRPYWLEFLIITIAKFIGVWILWLTWHGKRRIQASA